MRRPLALICLLALVTLAPPVRADQDSYDDPEAIKGTVVFEAGMMTARFDTEWAFDTYSGALAQGSLGILVYHQATRTYTWLLCRNFWSIYEPFFGGIQPPCDQLFAETHGNELATDETRLIWTFTGPTSPPAGPFSMWAYTTFAAASDDGYDYESYTGELTCRTSGARTTCTTSLAPDLEPGQAPPPPKPDPKPDPKPVSQEATGWGDWSDGCGTFGC